MPKRTMLIFWTSVAVGVLLLGGGVATAQRILSGGNALDVVLLLVTAVGFAGAALVAGRIVLVAARLQRRLRDS